jgi:hypothetical protein
MEKQSIKRTPITCVSLNGTGHWTRPSAPGYISLNNKAAVNFCAITVDTKPSQIVTESVVTIYFSFGKKASYSNCFPKIECTRNLNRTNSSLLIWLVSNLTLNIVVVHLECTKQHTEMDCSQA